MTPDENVPVDTTSNDNTVTDSVNLDKEIDFKDLSSMLEEDNETTDLESSPNCSMCDS